MDRAKNEYAWRMGSEEVGVSGECIDLFAMVELAVNQDSI